MTIELVEQVGRNIRDFSLFPKENEVLLPPNMCFEVVAIFDGGHGLIMVQCKQTETIDPILDMTPSTTPVPTLMSPLIPPMPPVPVSNSDGGSPSEAEQLAWALEQSKLLAERAAEKEAAAEKVVVAEKAAAEKTAAEKAVAEKASAEKAAAEKAAALLKPQTVLPSTPPPAQPNAQPSPPAIAAFWLKVGSSEEAARSASQLLWNSKNINDADCAVLAHIVAIGSLHALELLDLSDNQIGDAGMSAFSRQIAIGSLGALTRLLLSGNRIGDAGMLEFSRSITSGSLGALTSLHLGSNRNSRVGKMAIQQACSGQGVSAYFTVGGAILGALGIW
jgi:hypothetical protein